MSPQWKLRPVTVGGHEAILLVGMPGGKLVLTSKGSQPFYKGVTGSLAVWFEDSNYFFKINSGSHTPGQQDSAGGDQEKLQPARDEAGGWETALKGWAPGCSPRACWAKHTQSCVPGTRLPTNPTTDFPAFFSPVPVFPGRLPRPLSAAEPLLGIGGCC